jgi:hypothetical protein
MAITVTTVQYQLRMYIQVKDRAIALDGWTLESRHETSGSIPSDFMSEHILFRVPPVHHSTMAASAIAFGGDSPNLATYCHILSL